MQEKLLVVADVVKAHGIKGEIQVYPYTEGPESFVLFKKVFTGPKHQPKSYEILSVKVKGPKKVVLALKGLKAREDAEGLVGKKLWITTKQLPPLEEGEYYHYQIIGMSVEDENGNELGRVKDVMDTGAHSIYVVSGPKGEILIPAVNHIIKAIDPEKGIIKVDMPPGLIPEK